LNDDRHLRRLADELAAEVLVEFIESPKHLRSMPVRQLSDDVKARSQPE
jgi:hypothetical protein